MRTQYKARHLKRLLAMMLMLLQVGCATRQSHQATVVQAVVDAMGTTNTYWQGIDDAMQAVVESGDAAVPLLQVIVLLDQDQYGSEYEHPGAYKRARALYLLACIGTPEAEHALLAALKDGDAVDWRVICSLAILNGEDVIHGLVDLAWYDCRHHEKRPKWSEWWESTGRNMYPDIEF